MVKQDNIADAPILVTGGTGFLGRPLVEYLVAQGYNVRVLGRRPVVRWRRNPQIEHIRADITDPGIIEAILAGVKQVYHLAAATQGDWDTYKATTVDASQRLLDCFAAQGGGRLIFVSSIYNYDGGALDEDQVVDESYPLETNQQGRGHYALAKTAADGMAQSYLDHPLIKLTIVRPGVIYGPQMKSPLVGSALSLKGKVWLVLGAGNKHVPFVYLDDVVEGLVRIAESSAAYGQIYNFVHHQPCTQNDYIALYRQLSRDRCPVLKVPLKSILPLFRTADKLMQLARGHDQQWAYKVSRQLKSVTYSSEKLNRELGFAPATPLAEGLRRAWKGTSHHE